MKHVAAGIALAALAACGEQAPGSQGGPGAAPSASVSNVAAAPAVTSQATAPPPTLKPPAPSPRPAGATSPPAPSAPPPAPMTAAEKGEKGARGVLLTWARALELGHYDEAFAQWGADGMARSGMTRSQHADYWRRFKTITVAMPTGTMEGAAGSLYYEAPTTIVGKQRRDGKPYRLEGVVTLRRVNDVDGATPDQLHWHIERVELKPVA